MPALAPGYATAFTRDTPSPATVPATDGHRRHPRPPEAHEARTVSARRGFMGNRCACGGAPGPNGECATCRAKRLAQQDGASTRDPVAEAGEEEIVTATVEGDRLHRPVIEDFRRRYGLPEGGLDESGQPIGPSEAEIKYTPRTCMVASGPSYSPSGTIPVTRAGARKSATFSMAAAFRTHTGLWAEPRCCEVRQFIKWDPAFHAWRGGPPHGGFPASAAADTWHEDRDAADKRYGHRSGGHSDPIAGCGDEYKTGATRDQANGDTYCGRDTPGGPDSMTGRFDFQLKVIDVCKGGVEKASSPVISVNW